jgi:hypothetical protein
MSSNCTLDPRLVTRVRGEFMEMPGLSLTFRQACRLWQVDADTCKAVLQRLMAEKFLVQSHAGFYALYGTISSMSFPMRHSTTAA